MTERIENFRTFLDSSHSVYHAVANLEECLRNAGYASLSQGDAWCLTPGGKYYLTCGGSALIAFRVPKADPTGFMISASHADRPTFKVKEKGELSGKYTRLSTEKYGGMLISTWLDRPLSIAGRVLVETEAGVQSRLVDVDKDLLLIPNVAIHMNRKANEGYAWNAAVDTLPLLGGEQTKGKLAEQVKAAAGGEILGHDLYLYVRQNASIWGVENEYISAQGLDDLMCAWCCTQGFLQADSSSAVPVLAVFDSEEVGSATNQGAGSTLLKSTLERICKALHTDLQAMLAGSFLLSADNAHALHPNHPEYADPSNAPLPGKGVVLKFTAGCSYTTDGLAAALFRKICKKAEVPVQTYCNRADLPGGSTLGSISLSQVSVLSADIGLAQLAMHSAYETAATADVDYMVKAMETFYGSSLEINAPSGVNVL